MQGSNYSDAQKSFERAIQQKPDYVDAYYNLACLHALKGDNMESLIYLKQAISIDSSVRDWARNDTDLETVKSQTEFQEIIGDNAATD